MELRVSCFHGSKDCLLALPFLTRQRCFAVSSVVPVNNPPQGYNCRESIIMLFDGKSNLVTRATLHNSYEFKVVKSLPVSRVRT